MRWTFIIQQKIKVIVLLTFLIVLIGITNYLEHRNITRMDESFASIYYDRLVPAAEIFHMTQNLYNQRILMESALHDTQPVSKETKKTLAGFTRNTEKRIADFEKTFLVTHESRALVIFKHDIHEYEAIETEIIKTLNAGNREQALALYRDQLCPKFTETLHKLEDLSGIQTSVGKGIFDESRSAISNSSIVLTLQIAAVIIIGLMAHGLILASRITNANANNLHLN